MWHVCQFQNHPNEESQHGWIFVQKGWSIGNLNYTERRRFIPARELLRTGKFGFKVETIHGLVKISDNGGKLPNDRSLRKIPQYNAQGGKGDIFLSLNGKASLAKGISWYNVEYFVTILFSSSFKPSSLWAIC